jgi:hypothetical protein
MGCCDKDCPIGDEESIEMPLNLLTLMLTAMVLLLLVGIVALVLIVGYSNTVRSAWIISNAWFGE